MDNNLFANFDKLHTTAVGIDRIKRNLKIDETDVVKYCYDIILILKLLFREKAKTGMYILKILKLQ